jgi:putative transposase
LFKHKKYSYKLQGLNISHANHVWSTDITYIKIAGGMVYMAAIIDWHSKAVLSHRISNTMDSQLVLFLDLILYFLGTHPLVFYMPGRDN